MISIENFDASKANGPYINSPRSVEACHSLGFSPEELHKRPLSYFKQKNGSEKLAERRMMRYEDRRKEAVEQIKEARNGMLKRQRRMQEKNNADSTLVRSAHSPPRKNASSQLEQERAQLERIRRRQQQELEQMLAQEMKQARIAAENKAKMEAEYLLKKKKERERKRRLEEAANKKREKELAKQKALEEEEELRKQLQQRLYREGQEQKLKKAQELRRLKKEAARKDAEAKAKLKRSEEETARIFAEQQALALKKLEDMKRRDEERECARVTAQKEAKRIAKEKKMAAQKLIDEALAAQKRAEEEKQELYDRKISLAAMRRREKEKQDELERIERLRIIEEKNAHIEKAKEQAYANSKAKVDSIFEKDRRIAIRQAARLEEEAANQKKKRQLLREKEQKKRAAYLKMKEKEEERINTVRKEAMLKNSRANRQVANNSAQAEEKAIADQIKEEERLDKIERRKKMEAFKAKKLQEKRDRDAERARLIKEERDKMVKKRIEYKIEAKKKRSEVMKVFEKIQMSGKVEVSKDLEEKLGFKLDVTGAGQLPDHERPKLESRPIVRPKTASSGRRKGANSETSDMSYAVTGKVASRPKSAVPSKRPGTAGRVRKGVTIDEGALGLRKGNKNTELKPLSKTARPRSAAPRREDTERASAAPRSSRPKTAGMTRKKKSAKKKGEEIDESTLSPPEIIEKMRTRQTMHLLRVLEEEQQAEDRREKMLRGINDPAEKRRLDKVFSVERAKASEKIVRITEDNELVLANKMASLGMIR
jgi:hypothetical protein